MKNIKALLSCPSDVIDNFENEIHDAVDEINIYLEKLIDARIELIHYLTSSYSKYGKDAQDHLDDTLIRDADICLAFYYKKLGTPTKHYKSGTDEEINLMNELGKPVSVFKIVDYKGDKGSDELEQYFKDFGRSLYKVICGKENIYSSIRDNILSMLSEEMAIQLEIVHKPFNAFHFLESVLQLRTKREEIINYIEKINNYQIAIKTIAKQVVEQENNFEGPHKELFKQINDLQNSLSGISNPLSCFRQEITISDIFFDKTVDLLNRFVLENNLQLSNDFLSLQGQKVYISTLMGRQGELEFDDDSIKEKVILIQNLNSSLIDYYNCISYISVFRDYDFLPLAISNNTTVTQNKINLNIEIEKDYLFNYYNLKCFEGNRLSIELNIHIENILNPYKSFKDILEYDYGAQPPEVIGGLLNTKDYEMSTKSMIDWIADFDICNKDSISVISCSFAHLNPGDKKHLPTYLIVKKGLKEIKYNLTATNLSKRVFGVVLFDKVDELNEK